MLNSPQRVPSPGSAALQEALNLIAGLGSGDKNLKKMLEEMKDVQESNEKIVRDAVNAVSKLSKEEKALDAERDNFESEIIEFNKSMSSKTQELGVDQVDLEKAKTTFSDYQRSYESAYRERNITLTKREVECVQDSKDNEIERELLSKLKQDLNDRENAMSDGEGRLYQMFEALKTYLK